MTEQETIKKIREVISNFESMEEKIINRQRFLLNDKNKIPIGYPYPETKEKYMIREILTILNKQ